VRPARLGELASRRGGIGCADARLDLGQRTVRARPAIAALLNIRSYEPTTLQTLLDFCWPCRRRRFRGRHRLRGSFRESLVSGVARFELVAVATDRANLEKLRSSNHRNEEQREVRDAFEDNPSCDIPAAGAFSERPSTQNLRLLSPAKNQEEHTLCLLPLATTLCRHGAPRRHPPIGGRPITKTALVASTGSVPAQDFNRPRWDAPPIAGGPARQARQGCERGRNPVPSLCGRIAAVASGRRENRSCTSRPKVRLRRWSDRARRPHWHGSP